MKTRFLSRNRSGGTVLVEVMVGLVLSSLLLGMAGWLWLAGIRNLAASAHSPELVAQRHNALRSTSRNLDPAPQATRRTVTHAIAGTQIGDTGKATR
jgi:Tfp pilus assembly protein PilW